MNENEQTAIDQVENSLKAHSQTPVAHLAELGVLDERLFTIAAHGIVVNAEDVALLAEKHVHVAHCPKTYLKLAMRMAPLQRFLDAGVEVALGTDGPACNNDLNLLDVMRLAGLYQKNDQLRPEASPFGHFEAEVANYRSSRYPVHHPS